MSRRSKGDKSEMCDHQEKNKSKKPDVKGHAMKQHHSRQDHRHPHHNHIHHHHSHQSDDDDSQDTRSTAEDSLLSDHQRSFHHYHRTPRHRRLSLSETSFTSSFGSSSSSSSTSTSSSSSSSISHSSSSSSASSSSLSSESSSEGSGKLLLRRPQHSLSCTDISRKPKSVQDASIGQADCLPKQKSKSSDNGAQKKTQKNAIISANDGNFRKSKSMEALTSRTEGEEDASEDEKELEKRKILVKQNLLKEKMKFSAFLNEITRQVLSPMRLSTLGVTDAQKQTGSVKSGKSENNQRSRPVSADSASSSTQLPKSKSSHQHRRRHSPDPGEHMQPRPKSCPERRSSRSQTSQHHSNSPSCKRHQGNRRQHHRGDSNGYRHRDASPHRHHRYYSPVFSDYGDHDGSTHHHRHRHEDKHDGERYSPDDHHRRQDSSARHHNDHNFHYRHGDHYFTSRPRDEHHDRTPSHHELHSRASSQHHDNHLNTKRPVTPRRDYRDRLYPKHHHRGDQHGFAPRHNSEEQHHHGDQQQSAIHHQHPHQRGQAKDHHGDHRSSGRQHHHHHHHGNHQSLNQHHHHGDDLSEEQQPDDEESLCHKHRQGDDNHHHGNKHVQQHRENQLHQHSHGERHHRDHHSPNSRDQHNHNSHQEHEEHQSLHHPESQQNKAQPKNNNKDPHTDVKSLPAHQKNSSRNSSSFCSQEEEQTDFTGPSIPQERTRETGKMMLLQKDSEGLHQSLLNSAVPMECFGEFLSGQKLLEEELQRTRLELSNLTENFKILHENCSSTQQTNNLLEQKLNSVTQSMEGERERLSRRISALTEQLAGATFSNDVDGFNVKSVLIKSNDHFHRDDAIIQGILPIAPPPIQFMDSQNYEKVKAGGQEQSLGSVPEEEESDWSEMGEDIPRFLLNRGQAWRHREGDVDKDSESGGEEIARRHSPRPLQIPHLQFTIHNEILPIAPTNACPSGMTGDSTFRITTSQNLGSTILIRSASLEEIPLACQQMTKELRGTEAMMDLHHPGGESVEDLDNEIIHHWRISNERDGRALEAESAPCSLQSVEQMLNHFMSEPKNSEGRCQGWTGGMAEEVFGGEQTQL
ncbi:uncharacterized protein [Nerophis lumbriciformis]|uniref:uncharacterized protein n=1 Tax=Nerophis lumbriciformis TaxID=546530 RepID=UPI002ADF9E7D|nr:transcription initiation factor TFIID subunit 1-like [Nerophis lumbriciformis]